MLSPEKLKSQYLWLPSMLTIKVWAYDLNSATMMHLLRKLNSGRARQKQGLAWNLFLWWKYLESGGK